MEVREDLSWIEKGGLQVDLGGRLVECDAAIVFDIG
jgi:hypothetical protein